LYFFGSQFCFLLDCTSISWQFLHFILVSSVCLDHQSKDRLQLLLFFAFVESSIDLINNVSEIRFSLFAYLRDGVWRGFIELVNRSGYTTFILDGFDGVSFQKLAFTFHLVDSNLQFHFFCAGLLTFFIFFLHQKVQMLNVLLHLFYSLTVPLLNFLGLSSICLILMRL